jgi:hypothetical protein
MEAGLNSQLKRADKPASPEDERHNSALALENLVEGDE